jgi:hypothetical protein
MRTAPPTPGNPPQLCTATEPNGLQANDQEMFTDPLAIPIPGNQKPQLKSLPVPGFDRRRRH